MSHGRKKKDRNLQDYTSTVEKKTKRGNALLKIQIKQIQK